jgi:hypothetical protein
MKLNRILKGEAIEKSHIQAFVLLDNLCVLSFFPLLKACFKLRPATLCYFKVSKLGLALSFLLKLLKLVSGNPRKVKDLFLTDLPLNGVLKSRYEVFQACLKNQSKINKFVDKCLPKMDPRVREICATGVRKQWQLLLENALLQRNLGNALAHEAGIPPSRVILVSNVAPLFEMVNLSSKKSNDVKVISQPFENQAFPYSIFPAVLCISKFLLLLINPIISPKKEESTRKKRLPQIGVAATWGIPGFDKHRVDDLYWWRESSVSPERLVYMFERHDVQPTEDRLSTLKKLGIEPVVLKTEYSGDAPESMIMREGVSLKVISKRFCFYFKLALRNLSNDKYFRSVASLVSLQFYKSDALMDTYKKLNLRGLFHFEEGGLEFVTLASLRSDVIRIGTHWSCNTSPNHSTQRSHDVYFVWGSHNLKIFHDSGSRVKNMVIAGCCFSETSNKDARHKAQESIQAMKNQGARYTLSLFDNSLPSPVFYRFFLQWLIDDPDLILLIKSKGNNWRTVQEGELANLAEKAMKTKRLYVMDNSASPIDAALLSDFSIGISSISAIVLAALAEAKVLFLDYEKLDQGPLKPYSLFHSLGTKRCVFYDPDSLKQAVLEHVNSPESNPDLGDASPILDQIDPFRDGKAGQRIGEYVTWYLEGLDQNLSKDAAIKIATDKYADKWGADKVIQNL